MNSKTIDKTHPDTIEKKSLKKQKTPWSKRIYLILLGLIIFSFLKMVIGWIDQGPLPESKYNSIGGDFQLNSTQGPVSLSQFKGKITVLFFGYTNCPDICSTTLSSVATAFRLLNGMDEIDKIQGLFVTLDPQRDNTEIAGDYANYFHKKITGLSGTTEQVNFAAKKFLVGHKKETADENKNYAISHSSYIYIIRPDGTVGDLLSHTTPPKDIVKAVQQWLSWAKS